MAFVLDASITLTLALEDEVMLDESAFVERLATERAVAPSLWPTEIANTLLIAARRGRIANEQVLPRLAIVQALPVDIDLAGASSVIVGVTSLAIQHKLTAYDAAYLELAIRLGVPLATLDRRLANAATASGVEVIGQPG